jgi:hypothetical protein
MYCTNNNPTMRVYYQIGPDGIPATATTINAQAWLNLGQHGRYVSQVVMTISTAYWAELVDTVSISSNGFLQGSIYSAVKGSKKVTVFVEFSLPKYIPETGSIEIAFTGAAAYSHCRSAVSLQVANTLMSKAASRIGRVGCLGSGEKWIITGFQLIPASTTIRVVGEIDLPSTSGTLSGTVKAYSNQDANLAANGKLIASYSGSLSSLFVRNEDYLAPDISYSTTSQLPLRAGVTDRLYLRINLPVAFSGPNQGKLKLRLPRKSVSGQTTGFSINLNHKIVCQFEAAS